MFKSYDDEVAPKPHRLKVLAWDDRMQVHRCQVEGLENQVWVDLFVDGGLPDEWGYLNIIGHTVEVDYTHGYQFIASGTRVIEKAE